MSRPSLALSALLAVPLMLASSSARAGLGVADFTPTYTRQLVGLDDFTFDTDWFPMNAPLQLRLIVHGGNSVQIDMPGEGGYDWDAGAIGFTGDPQAGRLGVDIGFTLDALVRFDVLGLKWASDLIGPYDYAVIADQEFTPYLLPGNPDRPVVIDDETDPVTLVSVPVTPDILVAAGTLDIDIQVQVEAALEGHAIEAGTGAPQFQQAIVLLEGEAAPLPAGPGRDPLLVDGTLVCGLRTAPTIILKPTLVMEILGKKYKVADLQIPVAIPPFDEQIRFAPITMSFPRPPPGADSDGDSHGYSSSDSDAPTSDGDHGDASDASDASTHSEDSAEAGAQTPGDGGCGCDARGRDPAPLLLLALLGLRRRRR